MHLTRVRRAVSLAFALLLVPSAVFAQWLNYPTPGVPRLPDGKPNLSAPAPRTADGKPDLSGIWSGAGPSYRFNIAQDLETCLLYTSDAADERSSVDLGGRRII